MISSFCGHRHVELHVDAAAGWNSSLERMSAPRTDQLEQFSLKTLSKPKMVHNGLPWITYILFMCVGFVCVCYGYVSKKIAPKSRRVGY